MLEYFLLDWQDFDLPVYPIAVLSHKKRPSGCQLPLRVDFPNKQVLHFEFDVIDLARMDAEQERAVRKLELSRIEALSEALLDFTSCADLARWLRANSK